MIIELYLSPDCSVWDIEPADTTVALLNLHSYLYLYKWPYYSNISYVVHVYTTAT